MPPSERSERLERRVRRRLAGEVNEANPSVANTTTAQLTGNVLETIFGFLPVKDILRLRRVCSEWKETAKQACISSEFKVTNVYEFWTLETMMTALPNLQHLSILGLPERGERFDGGGYVYMNGDNPHEGLADETDNYSTLDIGIITNFQHLRSLAIIEAPLNGQYPNLFNFPLLEKLTINDSFDDVAGYHNWNLAWLEGLPMLRELECRLNHAMGGNLSSLRVLKDTLEQVVISGCRHVYSNNFMDLADFPHLKVLDLRSTYVHGDIRNIGANDFKALEELFLPRTVYGGSRYEFQSIAEVSVFMSQIYPLAKRFSSLSRSWRLSEESPDWYDDPHDIDEEDGREGNRIPPPFACELLRGARIGWRWRCNFPDTRVYLHDMINPIDPDEEDETIDPLEGVVESNSCEINWLEPEPDRESSNYEDYMLQLSSLQKEITFYRGYHNPPTEDEYNEKMMREWWI
eukprot:scaffold983_cov96-Skeletonema_dohrnii-CCMP3373.AAC.8